MPALKIKNLNTDKSSAHNDDLQQLVLAGVTGRRCPTYVLICDNIFMYLLIVKTNLLKYKNIFK